MTLELIEKYLSQQDLVTRLLVSDKKTPVDRILVAAPLFVKDNLVMEIYFSKSVEKEIDKFGLLNFYMYLPITPPVQNTNSLYAAILFINQICPLVGFGYDIDDPGIYFKYKMLIPGDEAIYDLIRETIYLICFQIDRFYNLLIEINNGKKSISDLQNSVKLNF
jgi:hypothetical protein